MKKQALSIILALVLLLSISIFPVFAQDIKEGEVVEYFGAIEDWTTEDLSVAGVDTEGVDLSEFIAKNPDEVVLTPETVDALDGDGLVSKSLITGITGKGSFVHCGDGKLTIELELTQFPGPHGDKNAIWVKSIVISKIDGDPNHATAEYNLEGCDVCESGGRVFIGANGKAKITGTVTVPTVYDNTFLGVGYTATVTYSSTKYGANEVPFVITGAATPKPKSFCPTNSLTQVSQKGKYEECGGKASFKVDITVPDVDGPKFVVPSEIWVNNTVYENYVCRYTLFGSAGYPFGGDYCTPGYQVKLKPGQRIRFEALIDDLVNPIAETQGGNDLDVLWRFGANGALITGTMESVEGPKNACDAKIVPLAPLEKFPTPSIIEKPIKPSGWYNTYEGAVVGLYQKCGRFAVMQIRLRNDGGKTGYINLPGGVAVNGGTPISYYWLSSSAPEYGKLAIAPGETVTLLGRLWLTNLISQTNSDGPVNVSVNFPDIGLFMNGKLYSDRVNWRCY